MTGQFHNGYKNYRSDPHPGQGQPSDPHPGGGTGVPRAVMTWFPILLCAFGVAVVWANGTGPTSPNITLEIQDHASNGSDRYTDTIASNGASYSCRYSGGEGGGGDVIFRTRGRVTVNVHLAHDSGYTIEDVSFREDTEDQLSWLGSHGGSTSAVIQDKNDAVQEAQYKITVRDEGANVTVPCDPIIANRT